MLPQAMTKSPAASIAADGSDLLLVAFVWTRSSAPCLTPAALYRWAWMPTPFHVTTRSPSAFIAADGAVATPVVVFTRNSPPCGAPERLYRWASTFQRGP